MEGFFQKVYQVVSEIPKGKVATYGQIARLAGKPHGSQRVGFALHANKNPEIVPCHRVVNRFGKISEGYKFGGPNIQRQLLESEGVVFDEFGVINLEEFGWKK